MMSKRENGRYALVLATSDAHSYGRDTCQSLALQLPGQRVRRGKNGGTVLTLKIQFCYHCFLSNGVVVNWRTTIHHVHAIHVYNEARMDEVCISRHQSHIWCCKVYWRGDYRLIGFNLGMIKLEVWWRSSYCSVWELFVDSDWGANVKSLTWFVDMINITWWRIVVYTAYIVCARLKSKGLCTSCITI